MARNWSNPMYFADPAGSFGTMWSLKGSGTEMAWDPNEAYAVSGTASAIRPTSQSARRPYGEIMAYVKEEAPFVVLYQPYESYGMTQKLDWKPLPGHIP